MSSRLRHNQHYHQHINTSTQSTHQHINTCVYIIVLMCRLRWCVDVLMCWCVDCVDVLMCWCVDVLMCWCVDVLIALMCWCVDVISEKKILFLLKNSRKKKLYFSYWKFFQFRMEVFDRFFFQCLEVGFRCRKVERFRMWVLKPPLLGFWWTPRFGLTFWFSIPLYKKCNSKKFSMIFKFFVRITQ